MANLREVGKHNEVFEEIEFVIKYYDVASRLLSYPINLTLCNDVRA